MKDRLSELIERLAECELQHQLRVMFPVLLALSEAIETCERLQRRLDGKHKSMPVYKVDISEVS